MASSVPFTLENAHQEQENGLVSYRIRVRVQGPGLTTLVRDPRASPFPDYRGDSLGFNTTTAADWNSANLVIPNANNSQFVLASTETADLEEKVSLVRAGPAWHPTKIDLIDLLDAFYAQREQERPENTKDNNNTTDIQTAGHVSAAILALPPNPSSEPVAVAIWAWQPGLTYGIARETHIYSVLQARAGPGTVAAPFVGHITDNGTRVVGFLLERVAGARAVAGPGDLEGCRAALGRLHAADIAYGAPLGRDSFLVCADGRVLMQRFGGAFETGDGGGRGSGAGDGGAGGGFEGE